MRYTDVLRFYSFALVVTGCAAEADPLPDPDTILLGDGKADGGATIDGPYDCPAGARFTTNGSDEVFCLFENLSPPADASAYCDYLLDDGIVGYAWPLASAPDHACPDTARRTDNGEDLGFCLFEDLAVPPETQPYCNYLESSGVVGYEWSLCPEGGRVAGNGAGTQFCIFEQLVLPADARSYCDYVRLGYVGFYYELDANPDFACPAPFAGATNGAGLGFCLLDNLAIPSALDIQPYCDADRGYVGFYWPER